LNVPGNRVSEDVAERTSRIPRYAFPVSLRNKPLFPSSNLVCFQRPECTIPELRKNKYLNMSPEDGILRASAILARAQRRDVCPNIWASLRSESGLPAWALRRYAATAASLTAPASGTAWSRCPLTGMVGGPAA